MHRIPRRPRKEISLNEPSLLIPPKTWKKRDSNGEKFGEVGFNILSF
jgi:hypothetical protein